jgi:hypothetical protein
LIYIDCVYSNQVVKFYNNCFQIVGETCKRETSFAVYAPITNYWRFSLTVTVWNLSVRRARIAGHGVRASDALRKTIYKHLSPLIIFTLTLVIYPIIKLLGRAQTLIL